AAIDELRSSFPGDMVNEAEERFAERFGDAALGTPAYMAPEVHVTGKVDHRSDQFSFCVALYEALYGERPFAGRSPRETGMSVTRGAIAEPRRPAAAPVWVRRVLEQGLRPVAEERHTDMRTLLAALAANPWRARRRVASIAGVVIAGAAGGYILTPPSGDASACAVDAERWAGVWDEPRRERVEAAFTATGRRYAEQAFASVSSALDGYVDRWNTLHREACEATLVHKLQPRSDLELQWACLSRRRGEVAALTDEMLVADGRVVEHAVEAVRGLRRLDGCSDVAALGREPALPTDERQRERVEALRARLVDARAKAQAARYEQALEIVGDVVERAERLGDGAVVAEAKLQLGVVHEAMGHFAEAQRWLLESIWAGQASGHDELVAQSWTQLVWVVGVELLDTAAGEQWGRFADAAVTHVGDPPRLRAQLLHNLGGVLYRQGRLEEALDHYTRALHDQQEFLGPEHPQIATTLNHTANTLIELKRYAEADDYARRSLSLRERVLGPDHPKVAASLNNIGELRRKQGKVRESLDAAEASLTIVAGTGGPEELVALVLLADAQRRLRRWRPAAITLERALALREAAVGPSHESLVPTLRSLADARVALGEMDAAAILRMRATAIETDVKDAAEQR
ncbi:MAG: tetratricopeptide repeat-containing protein kinase family protein, partial [Myxococcota bacterium]